VLNPVRPSDWLYDRKAAAMGYGDPRLDTHDTTLLITLGATRWASMRSSGSQS